MYPHRRTQAGQAAALALDYFEKLCASDSLEGIMSLYKKLCEVVDLKPAKFPDFFPQLSATLGSADAQDLLSKYAKRASSKCYESGKACHNSNVLIIGAGPCGLRTAIEAQLLGAKVVVIEKRPCFSRNNVLHLWPFVIADLKGLGAKKFYGKFCPGAIDHISISQLQLMLLKIALILGVEVHLGVEFQNVIKPGVVSGGDSGKSHIKKGWRAKIHPSSHPISNYEFDVLVGADGRRNTLKGFKRKVLRAKLAIAITANFINSRTAAEAKVQEISGVSFIYKQDFFNELCQATGIDLENIVYYKDETHYFVMTAKKHSLLWKGVLYDDHAETDRLLAPDNVDRDALENYVLEAVKFATDSKLPNLKFALNHRHEPDVALIDFTNMYQAENACRAVQRKGYKLLLGLVGDSLLEPFWPTGSGCARGFLSSFDMCWTIRSWAKGAKNVMEVLAERESIYRLLAQSTHENLSKDHSLYNVEPQSRYPYINLESVKPFQVDNLFDSDEKQGSVKLQSTTPTKNKQQQRASSVPERNKAPDQAPSNQRCSGNSHGGSSTTISPATAVKTNRKLPVSAVKEEPVVAKEEEHFPDVEEMLEWFRSQVQPYEIKVDGIQDVFVNGNVLCAIIHRFRPDLLPEFPLPPEVQQGNNEVEQGSYRNQLAFDFLKGEYSLHSTISGAEATRNVSANLSLLIDYTCQVYLTFVLQKPQLLVKPLEVITTPSNNTMFDEKPAVISSFCCPTEPVKTGHDKPEGYVSTVWTSSTNYMKNDDDDSDTFSNASSRRIKRSSSIQRIVQRLDNNSYNNHNNPPPSYVPPDYNRFVQDDRDQTYCSSSEVYANPYRTINNEMRRKRMEDAEKSKVEALKMVHMFNAKKKEERDEERAEERQRVVRALRAQQVYETPEETSPTKVVEKDEFFNEYNMRLWRKSKPTMEERTMNLETKLFNSGLERTPSFCSQPPVKKLQPPPPFRQGLMRSATERHVCKGNACLPASVQKFRREDSKVASIGSKLLEGHGHTVVNTYFDPKAKSTKPAVNTSTTTTPAKNPAKLQMSIKSQLPGLTSSESLKITGKKTDLSPHKDPIKAVSVPKEINNKRMTGSTMNVETKKAQETKKKNDFSEYFKAKELAKSKSTSNFSVTRARSDVGSAPSIEAKAKLLTESTTNKHTKLAEQQATKLKRSMMNEGLNPGMKLQLSSPLAQSPSTGPVKERPTYNITQARPKSMVLTGVGKAKTPEPKTTAPIRAPPPRVTRQSTVDEFEELYGISEHDEAMLADLNSDELNHLLDWTEKTFSTRKGVELE